MDALQEKYDRLKELLGRMGPVAVAFSGGVDSSLLLQVAVEVTEGEALALTADTVLSPRREIHEATALAARLGARHLLLPCDILGNSQVTANGPERCYHCKMALFRLLQERALQEGFPALLDGSNVDDLEDYRPGRRALQELGIASPLLEAGFTKADVRQLSRDLGLSTGDKPAAACLASRIPCGTPLTLASLGQVERCEAFLHEKGIRGARVRHHGDLARIEVEVPQLGLLLEEGLRQELTAFFAGQGFRFTTLDLGGYRTGSMNFHHDPGANP